MMDGKGGSVFSVHKLFEDLVEQEGVDEEFLIAV